MFAMRFQQLSAPVMAKGVEDTAFYRYYPLASLNEVGGDPSRFGISVNAFHRRNLIRQRVVAQQHERQFHARYQARRRCPRAHQRAVGDAGRMVSRHSPLARVEPAAKTKVAERHAPDANEEYLLYQTLVGTWPLYPMNPEEHEVYIRRIDAYMQKALHEAKLHTSWVNPNSEYEQAVTKFVERVLEPAPGNIFLQELRQFQAPIANAGMWNSIAQLVLKIASPGVPDFYQGNDLWAFDLVDPDNRRAVNYDAAASDAPKLARAGRARSSGAGRSAARESLRRRASSSMSPAKPCDSAAIIAICSHKVPIPPSPRRAAAPGMSWLSRARSANQTMIAVAGRFFLNCATRIASRSAMCGATPPSRFPGRPGTGTFEIFSPAKP